MRGAILTVVLVVLGGCGAADGLTTMAISEDDAGAAPMAPDAGTAKLDSGAASAPDTRAPDSRPADTQQTDARSVDTAPPSVLSCPQYQDRYVIHCGVLTPSDGCGSYGWKPMWKDGRECATCRLGGSLKSGCTEEHNPDECTGAALPDYICVLNCNECAYQ